jgi:type IV secretion system T-DNA border endonuclease VirD2
MSVVSVPELLRRGALAPAHLSAVDAVMGEDWAHLELGRGSAVRPPADEGRRTGPRRRAAVGGVLAPNPQALVKLIGSGGTATSRGLKAQMTYLSRQGDVPLRSSESTFGVELGAADAEQLAAAWGLPETDRGGADRTSHFVVSFPQGTDPEAAERAGRAWAAALFDSGAYGDRWDYYTAFHKDTTYPHIHVVVGRRGLDEGQWLRVSSRGELSFDRLREVQVEVAAREGIALTGTTRLSRGVHDRPVPDAEYRRARAEGREAVPPAHTEASAIATAAEILAYARDYQGAAAAIAEQAPQLADRLEAAAVTILAGRELAVEREAAPRLTPQEAMRMVETIEQIQAEVRQNFVELEADIRAVENPAKRAEFLRELAGLKGAAAPLIRDDMGLQGYRADVPHADYRGLVVPAGDGRAAAIKAEADREVGRLAERFGLKPEATLARFSAESVSGGLGRDYRAEELAERAADRAARRQPAERVDEAAAQLADFHRRAGAIYRAAAERLRELEREDPRGELGTDRDGTRGRGGHQRQDDRASWGADRQGHAAPDRGEAPDARSKPSRPAGRRGRDDDDRSR